MDLLEIFWVVFEIAFDIVGELILEVGQALFESLDPAARDALFVAFLCFAAGALLGLVSGMALPDRLLPTPRTPGLSLIASPLACGFAMQAWGSFRREGGHPAGALATFHGSAAFALGAALGRFVLVA
jgi:hypothetical protein